MELIFSLTEIKAAASKIVELSKNYNVIAFYGGMGVGKTTFITAMCEELKVDDLPSSPTFSIINEYQSSANHRLYYHIDLYRLQSEQELIQAGVEDCFYSGNTCFVEWPEKAFGLLPDKILSLHFTAISDLQRKITW